MSQHAGELSLRIERIQGYEFKVSFDKAELGQLVVDEPPPLGHDAGPNPARILAAAIGSCLSASLVFCLSRAKHEVGHVLTEVQVELVRNEQKRLRIGRVDVTVHPELENQEGLGKCLEAFEDFCVVTQSVREGIDVRVRVEPELSTARQ